MKTGDLIVAFFMAAALFIVILPFLGGADIPTGPNIHSGILNSTQLSRLQNTTYLRVYYSPSCPACKAEMPVLHDVSDSGVFIQLLDVYEFSDSAISDGVEATPTIFIIGNNQIVKLQGFVEKEKLLEEIEKVTDKSNLGR